MEKTNNKKVIIAICAVVAVIILAVVLALVLKKPSYKKQINLFVEGMNDSEQMEKFVDKYVDFRALYAMEKIEKDEDIDGKDEAEVRKAFEKAYKEAKKEDYTKDDFKKEVKDLYKMYAAYKDMMGEGATIELKEVGKAEEYKEMKAFKQVPFKITVKSGDNSEDLDLLAVFYKNKFILVSSESDSEEE